MEAPTVDNLFNEFSHIRKRERGQQLARMDGSSEGFLEDEGDTGMFITVEKQPVNKERLKRSERVKMI